MATSKVLKPRRGSTAEHANFRGQAFEITFDTDKKTIVAHDGLTMGGFPLAHEAALTETDVALRALIEQKLSESAFANELQALESALRGLIDNNAQQQVVRDNNQDNVVTALDTTLRALIAQEVGRAMSAANAAQGSADEKVATVNGLTPDSNGNVDVGGMPLGTVFPYTGKDVPAGTLRADGSIYANMQDSFPEFYEWVVNSGLTVPLADYTLVEGSCGFYGLDTTTGIVRMPTLAAGVFGTVTAGQYGQAVQAGLPNITGNVAPNRCSYFGEAYSDGAFSHQGFTDTVSAVAEDGQGVLIKFDASRSNPIYGRADTVTPSHVKYPWVIVVYNAAVPPSVAQAGEFVELLDGKLDKTNPKDSEGRNLVISLNGVNADANGALLDYVLRKTGEPGYIKLSNGLIVQWTGGSFNHGTTWTFPIPFSATNSYVVIPVDTSAGVTFGVTGFKTASCTIYNSTNNQRAFRVVAIGI